MKIHPNAFGKNKHQTHQRKCNFCHELYIGFGKKYCSNQCRFKAHKDEVIAFMQSGRGQAWRDKISKANRGANNGNWKGGRKKTPSGYILIKQYDRPGQERKKRYFLEHRIVMEKHIGRYLTKNEVVHHINGIRDDNRIENLQLLSTHHVARETHKCPNCGYLV